MPRNGNGTYTPPAGQPVVSGTTVLASTFNSLVNDVSTELTKSISTDGQTPMGAALPMGGNKITGMAPGTQATDAVRLDQITLGGASLLGFKQTGASSVAATGASKLSEYVSAKDYGCDITGVADGSPKANALLAENAAVRFTPGTYLFNEDLVLNSGNYVLIDAGAKLIFNGARFTSYLQNNITIELHGEISSINMAAAPARSGWPSDTGGAGPTTTNERGFLEFGGISSSLASNFKVFGNGKIHGDWVGTPSIANLWTGDLNYKGIATFYANNVEVSGIEVYGFRGEAAYYYTSVAAKKIKFRNLYVHDVNFNALNFNCVADISDSYIEDCRVDTAFQGIEISSGRARRNSVRNCISHPVQFGGGTVLTIDVDDNDLYVGAGQGLNGINAAGNPASITGVVGLNRNRIYGATESGIYATALAYLKATGNVVNGYSQNVTPATSGNGISVDANVSRAVIEQNVFASPGANANGSIRSLSPDSAVKNNFTQDSVTGKMLLLVQGPVFSATLTQTDYKLIQGVGASGIGFETVYGNGMPENLTAISAFAKVSAILTAVSGGEVGTYTISTYKPLGSSTVAASVLVDNYGQLQPALDNSFNLGIAGKRWAVIYAGTGTINTSDERSKTPAQPIDAAALRAWAKVQFCQFKYLDAVAQKGDGARWHFGVIAQRVKEAFESEGLDPFAYGVLCYDEWEARPAMLDGDGAVSVPAQAAGNRFGIRYEEALILECAYLRSKLVP